MLVLGTEEDEEHESLVRSLDEIAVGLRRSRFLLWLIATELVLVLLIVGGFVLVELFK